MKPGGGKSKGNNFEGQIAKKLTNALAPLAFIRTPGSGARLGGKNFEAFGKMFGEEATKLFTGDVAVTNEKDEGLKFRFSIECKSYKTPDGFTSLVAGTANVFKWMDESVVDAAKINQVPLLVFKWNHTPVFVAMLQSDNKSASKNGNPFIEVNPKLTVQKAGGPLIDVFLLDDLLPLKEFWVAPLTQ